MCVLNLDFSHSKMLASLSSCIVTLVNFECRLTFCLRVAYLVQVSNLKEYVESVQLSLSAVTPLTLL